MNDLARRLVMDKRMRGRDYRAYDRHNGEYYGEIHGDYARNSKGRYSRDYADDYEMDGRRGVKGTGYYGMGGRGYDGNYDEYSHDYARSRYDRKESGEDLHLTKKDMQEWKRSMENADGTLGEHFDGEKIKQMAEKLGVRYKGYDEKELCLVTNMLYSDFCEALRGIIPPEKELMTYVKLAKAWLEDEDAPEGSEKLALYYYCIVEDEEE
ncbi:MAG: hypothetical protein K2O36_03745 [Ruminococcus sp.]|nr:hypothetical protein [Ruminococcus sp.]